MKGFIKILLLLCALSLAKAKPVPETFVDLGEIWNGQNWNEREDEEDWYDEEEDEEAWDEDWDEEEDEEDWDEEEDEEVWVENDEDQQRVEDSNLKGRDEPEKENDEGGLSDEEKNDGGEEEKKEEEVEIVDCETAFDADTAIDDAHDESEEVAVPKEKIDLFKEEILSFKRALDAMQKDFEDFEVPQTQPAEPTPRDVDFIATVIVLSLKPVTLVKKKSVHLSSCKDCRDACENSVLRIVYSGNSESGSIYYDRNSLSKVQC